MRTSILSLLAFTVFTQAKAGDVSTVPTPKVEARSQDSAYAMVFESYRQIQTSMIEADYSKRLKAISQLKDAKEREHLSDLAAQERELQMAKLQETLGNFTRIGVPKTVDAKEANEKLRTLKPFTPAAFGPGENRPSRLLPAGAQMIYGQPH